MTCCLSSCAAACSAALEPLLRQHPGYSNLFTVDIRGDLVCSAVPAPTPVNVADRDYFQAVLRTRALAVGTPTVAWDLSAALHGAARAS